MYSLESSYQQVKGEFERAPKQEDVDRYVCVYIHTQH